MSRSKQKGTRWETEVTRYLEQYFPGVERRVLVGPLDRGDISGVPGWTIECKNTNTSLWGPFMDEAERERVNCNAEFGLLVVKRRMKPVSRAFAVLPLEDMAALMCLDVYGSAPNV